MAKIIRLTESDLTRIVKRIMIESDKEKVLRKSTKKSVKIDHNTPNFWDKFYDLKREKQIEFIDNYKQHIERLLPTIIKYFKTKYDDSVKIEVGSHKVNYVNERYSYEKIIIKFDFDGDSIMSLGEYGIKKKIYDDLESVFNINPRKSGTPLDIKVYVDGI